MQNLKVRMPIGYNSTAAFVNSGFEAGKRVTFHAFSDQMKARVLEMIANGVAVEVSLTDEKPRIGEWLE